MSRIVYVGSGVSASWLLGNVLYAAWRAQDSRNTAVFFVFSFVHSCLFCRSDFEKGCFCFWFSCVFRFACPREERQQRRVWDPRGKVIKNMTSQLIRHYKSCGSFLHAILFFSFVLLLSSSVVSLEYGQKKGLAFFLFLK